MADRRRALARAPWRTVSTRQVYANRWIRVREDVAELPDGRTTLYGVVECRPCIGVLPFLDASTVLLVGQYRYVTRAFAWEMPTGAMQPDESEEAAVQRELDELRARLPVWMQKIQTYDFDKYWKRFVAVLQSPCQATRAPFLAADLPVNFVQRAGIFGRIVDSVLDHGRKNPSGKTVVLYGTGGFGKTTLALSVCHHSDTFAACDGGVLWVTLGEQPQIVVERARNVVRPVGVGDIRIGSEIACATKRTRQTLHDAVVDTRRTTVGGNLLLFDGSDPGVRPQNGIRNDRIEKIKLKSARAAE